MRLRHGAHVSEAGGRLHSAEPGRSLRGHQPRLGLPHLVRLRARLRLYTDVACGVNAGIDTVFVLSGEGTMADIDTYQIHPTWVYPDIGTLYRKLEETV